MDGSIDDAFTDETIDLSYYPRDGYMVESAVFGAPVTGGLSVSPVTPKQDPVDGYYMIGSYEELVGYQQLVSSHIYVVEHSNARLIRDIDATGHTDWIPIGQGFSYSGTFDGQGHTIRGLNSTNSAVNSSYDGGLVSFLNSGGFVMNVGLIEAEIIGASGIAGINVGTVQACYVSGTITGETATGGVVGWNYGEVVDCYSTAGISSLDVSKTVRLGGVIGVNEKNGTVENCYSTGSVTYSGISDNVCKGTVIGRNEGTVKNCFGTLNVMPVLSAIGNDQNPGGVTNVRNSAIPVTSSSIWDFTETWYMESGAKWPLLQVFRDALDLTGAGTEENPFRITSEEDWNELADAVAEGHRISGRYFEQTEDISVTRMVGTLDHPFAGVYNGGGKTLTFTAVDAPNDCAPFSYIRNASIRDLHTKGTIHTANRWAAGLAANAGGTCTIENCRSGMRIESSHEGDGTHAGFISVLTRNSDAHVVLEGCVFDGALLGEKTTNCAGFVGYARGYLQLRNCLFLPSERTVQGEENFYRTSDDSVEILAENCYYGEEYFNKDQGIRGWAVTAGDGVTLGFGSPATAYSVSAITAYEKGMQYGSAFYAAEDETVPLTLKYSDTVPAGQKVRYYASAGTLTESGSGYTLTMPAGKVTITAELVSVTDKRGDVNGDNEVDAKDLTALARHVAKIELITEPELLQNADVDGSGDISAADLTKLARFVVKIDTTL